MKRLLLLVAFFATLQASAQQVNPVPDYVFSNRMSAGRNTVTDTAAYFSIGPRYGATRGMMPPMVVDTASFSANKRNGLLIFSVQKNKFLYWDSVGVKWAEMAGTAGTALTSADTAALLSTRAWRQKGIDSLAAIRIGGSGTTNYVPKFTASTTLSNSIIQDNGSGVSINVSPSSAIALYTRALSLTGTGFYSDNGLNTGFIVKYESAPITNIGNDYNQPLGFLTNNTERVRITAAGNVGVGSQSPGGKLTINSSSGDHIQIQRSGGTDRAIVLSGADQLVFGTWTSPTQMALTTSGELLISTTIDGGDYKLQVDGNIYNTGSLTTGAPSGGSIKPWKIGEAATVSPTSPNRTIRVEIDGTVYYLHAKTTND